MLNLILGVTLLIVAVTVAVSITVRPRTAEQARFDSAGLSPALVKHPAADRRPESGKPAPRTTSRARTAHTESPATQTGRQAEATFSVQVPANHPGGGTLVARAERVEAFANQRLDRLTRQLDLTPAQREKLFPVLARSSDSFDPAMRIFRGGSPIAAVAANPAPERIEDVLDPAQEMQLVEETMNDMLLWEEIIARLVQRLDQQTPAVPASETPASESSGGRRGNLFDTIEQE